MRVIMRSTAHRILEEGWRRERAAKDVGKRKRKSRRRLVALGEQRGFGAGAGGGLKGGREGRDWGRARGGGRRGRQRKSP